MSPEVGFVIRAALIVIGCELLALWERRWQRRHHR